MQLAIQVGGGQVRHDQTGIEAIIEEAQVAESLGFDAVFVPDHYVFESLGTVQERSLSSPDRRAGGKGFPRPSFSC